jgi:hypothetical protein
MNFYLFRLIAEAFTVEAEYRCGNDLDAVSAAEDLAADVEAVEIWDGKRLVALISRATSADVRLTA